MPALDTTEVEEKARALWPVVADETAYPSARFTAWQDWAEMIAGPIYTTRRLEAVANLVVHAVLRSSDGAAPTGEVTSLRTLSLSASFAPGATGGALQRELSVTRPGQAFLAIQATIARLHVPRVIRACR